MRIFKSFFPLRKLLARPWPKGKPIGKENIKIVKIDPVGNYAIKIVFSDGHDTGIYSWKYFQWLAANKRFWARYIEETVGSGHNRLKATLIGKII